MRIALIDPSLFTWPYDHLLCEGLRAAGHETFVFGRYLGEKDQIRPHESLRHVYYSFLRRNFAAEIPKPALRLLKGAEHWFSNQRLLAALTHWRPDAIHFQWAPLPLFDIGLIRQLREIAPVVLTVHDTVPFNGNAASNLQTLGFERLLKGFDALVVHTEQGRRRISERLGDAVPVVRIAHGLLHDTAPVQVLPATDSGEQIRFLLFGKLKPYKGLDVLIDAAAVLPPAIRARCLFQIVGEPHMDMEQLLVQAKERGVTDCFSFRFDYVDDSELDAIFAGAAASIFPYREIEASGVLMAAIAKGQPVIASRIGAFAEYLEDGRQALLVPAGDSLSLARAITRFVSNAGLRHSLSEGMTDLRRSIPSWLQIARDTAGLYEAIHAGRPLTRAQRMTQVRRTMRPTPET